MSQIELMVMHRKVYQIIDNLHDLCCRGTKDYREALANVQDYNMTKILSRKCSIPDPTGDVKQSRCDFNVMYAIQMDVEVYNYLDTILRDYNNGRLTHENLLKERKRLQEEELSQAATKSGQQRLSAGIVFLTANQAPQGMVFQRDNIDVMNNFFIHISSRAFTNIEVILDNERDNVEIQKTKDTLHELEKIKPAWNSEILDEVNDQYDRLDKVISKSRAEAIIAKGDEAKAARPQLAKSLSMSESDKKAKAGGKASSKLVKSQTSKEGEDVSRLADV